MGEERIEKMVQDKEFSIEANRNGVVLRGWETSKESVCVCVF